MPGINANADERAARALVLSVTRDELASMLLEVPSAGDGVVVRAGRTFLGAVDQPEYVARPGGDGFSRTGQRHAGRAGADSLLANFGESKFRNLVLGAAAVRALSAGAKGDDAALSEALVLSGARRFAKLLSADPAKAKPIALLATKAEIEGALSGKPKETAIGKALATFAEAVRQPEWKDGRPTGRTLDGEDGLKATVEGFGKARQRRVELSVAAIQEVYAKLGAKDPAHAVSAMVELGEAGQDAERRGEAIARARQAAARGR